MAPPDKEDDDDDDEVPVPAATAEELRRPPAVEVRRPLVLPIPLAPQLDHAELAV